jgi:molecular chaperone GrpE (heat shock protein)
VPSAIAAVIASFGTSGAIWFLLRGFKKSKGQMIAALKALGLSADTLNKVLERLDQVEKRLEEVETITRENAEKTYTEKVIPLLDDVEKTLCEIHAMKDEIKNGTQKIIKSLTSEV